MLGTPIADIKGDTRSLDNGSFAVKRFHSAICLYLEGP